MGKSFIYIYADDTCVYMLIHTTHTHLNLNLGKHRDAEVLFLKVFKYGISFFKNMIIILIHSIPLPQVILNTNPCHWQISHLCQQAIEHFTQPSKKSKKHFWSSCLKPFFFSLSLSDSLTLFPSLLGLQTFGLLDRLLNRKLGHILSPAAHTSRPTSALQLLHITHVRRRALAYGLASRFRLDRPWG